MSEQSIGEKCFVAFKPCGCLAAVAMERSSLAPQVVTYAQEPGYRVEHLTMSEYRASLKRCSEHPRQEQPVSQSLPGMENVAVRPAERRAWTG